MIADFLDERYVLNEARAQRDWLMDLLVKVKAREPKALAAMHKHGVERRQIEAAIRGLTLAIARHEMPLPLRRSITKVDKAFIPSDPVLCNFQTGMTEIAARRGNVVSLSPEPPVRRRTPGAVGKHKQPLDTSPTEHLKRRSAVRTAVGPQRAPSRAPFVEGDDIHYGLDGFFAKFGALFSSKRKFNRNPAIPSVSGKPLRLFLFGDWGTGLPLAQKVTEQIRRQIGASDGTRQQHVVHLGDVYYVGKQSEYIEHVLAGQSWPVNGDESGAIGSWSLNGNHDMYAGGHGYFDTLLREGRFARWHRDVSGEPSSFFVIEDANWQFFGLDSSWDTPSLGAAIIGEPTLKDYGGQNGILTKEQVKWMARHRDPSKGCVLITHHQPASSRAGERQHSDQAIKLLKDEGVYSQIDAWFWGHEHRCVVFKPKAQRTSPVLSDAPPFCACIGHGGVPVTEKNFDRANTIPDVGWQEDKVDATSPIYGGERILPFGFARVDTSPSALDIQVFDHDGDLRHQVTFARAAQPPAHLPKSTSPAQSLRKPTKSKSTKPKAAGRKPAKKKGATRKAR